MKLRGAVCLHLGLGIAVDFNETLLIVSRMVNSEHCRGTGFTVFLIDKFCAVC